MPALRWLSLTLLVGAVVAFGVLLVQRSEADALRSEVAVLRDTQQTVADLRTEQQRLLAAQPTPAELERLRGDRAALVRLRREIENLQESADRKAREAPSSEPERPPSLILAMTIGADGTTTIDGAPTDMAMLKQRLASFAGRPDRIEFRLRVPEPAEPGHLEAVKRASSELMTLAREMKLRLSVRLEKSGR